MTLEPVVQPHATLVDLPSADERRARAKAGEWKERPAATQHFRDDVDLDLVQGAALEEGHLQLPAAEHPDVAVVQPAKFVDQRIDVASDFQWTLRVVDRPRCDDDDTFVLIGPRRELPRYEIIRAAP